MRASAILGALLSVTLPFVAANSHAAPHRRHDELARRAKGDLARRQGTVNGPYSPSRFTFYEVGLGACGITNVPSDFIVALNTPQYGGGYPGPNCFLEITIQVGGQTTTAQITDECPGCPENGLDMSEGLFQYFADLGVGVLTGTWWVNGASPTPTTTWAPPPPPTTTWAPPPPPPPPTTTWAPPPPPPTTTWSPPPPPTTSEWSSSSAWVPPPSSSSVWVPPPSSSSVWVAPSSSSVWVPSSSASSAVPTPSSANALEAMNQAVVGMAALMVAEAGQN